MRGIWGLLGLVVALVIVMLLAKQQITGGSKSAGMPAATEGTNETVRSQSQQTQQQVRQALDAAMATRREPAADQ